MYSSLTARCSKGLRCGRQLPCQLPARHAAGRQCSSQLRAIQLAEHAAYLEEVAVTSCPKRLPTLLRVLQARGAQPLSPSDRSELHPLVVPLCSIAAAEVAPLAAAASSAASAAASPALAAAVDAAVVGEELVLGLLRWPRPQQHKAMPLPVVGMSRGALGVQLVARGVDEHLHRLLADEDVAGTSGRPLAEAAGSEGAELYSQGAVAASGLADKMHLYYIKKVGMFPDVCEALALGHLVRGDATSALVAAEWYKRTDHFPGWGRPQEFEAELYQQLGKRREECRDAARNALRNAPWWTLRSYAAVQGMALLEGGPERVQYQVSEEAAAVATAAVTGMQTREPRTPQEVALDAATKLLNLVAAGATPGGYNAVREQLADQYAAAGLADVCNFINAA